MSNRTCKRCQVELSLKEFEKRKTTAGDPQGPYTIVNVQLVCHRVNLIKHTMPEDELYWWCKNIVTNKEKY